MTDWEDKYRKQCILTADLQEELEVEESQSETLRDLVMSLRADLDEQKSLYTEMEVDYKASYELNDKFIEMMNNPARLLREGINRSGLHAMCHALRVIVEDYAQSLDKV